MEIGTRFAEQSGRVHERHRPEDAEELRLALKQSLEACSAKPRDEWLFNWPSQIILVVSQIFWVQEVEKAFQVMQRGRKMP